MCRDGIYRDSHGEKQICELCDGNGCQLEPCTSWRILDNGCWRRELPDGTVLNILRRGAPGAHSVWAWRHFAPELGDNSRIATNIAIQGGFATDYHAAAAADLYWNEIVEGTRK